MIIPDFGPREALELERATRYVIWRLQVETDFGLRIKVLSADRSRGFELDGRVLDELSHLDPIAFPAFLDGFIEHLKRLTFKRYNKFP
jgi:hypothetical protein